MPKYLISASRPDYQGNIVGIHFQDGAATVDPAADDQQRAALGYFQRAGYSMVVLPEEAEEPPTEAGPEPFDPAAHSVDDVLAHLAQAAPDERARVIAAESDSKARKTILAASETEQQGAQS
ncbi:hypothetical protein [Kitasatospora sp. NPDC050543]|uniref:hypothetical protein n=1 Tax=Kitasatospora sp. NPDC050543 TaxID=3364054 RepID=UPI0037AAC8E0